VATAEAVLVVTVSLLEAEAEAVSLPVAWAVFRAEAEAGVRAEA
jgi:hypothetical protein